MDGIVKRFVVAVLLAVLGLGACGEDEEPASRPADHVSAFLGAWAVPIGDERHDATGLPLRVRRVKDDAEMVLVPGGRFQMGAVPQDKTALKDEKPRHAVVVKPFYMDINEVTRGQFSRFVAATGFVTVAEVTKKGGYGIGPPPDPSGDFGLNWRSPMHGGEFPDDPDAHPVTQVTHTDATAYALWANAELPTEAQFEFVLRGGVDGRIYPWGDDEVVDPAEANLAGEELIRKYPEFRAHDPPMSQFPLGHEDPFVWTAPVRSFPPNAFGLYDLSGNVSEWCRDIFDFYGEKPVPTDPTRILRGASWRSHRGRIRCSWRTSASSGFARDYWGFRCVKSLPEPKGGG